MQNCSVAVPGRRDQWENEANPKALLIRSTLWTSHRSSTSSSACRKSRGRRCHRASRSAQCSVADLREVQVSGRMGRNVLALVGRQASVPWARGDLAGCQTNTASDLRPVATAAGGTSTLLVPCVRCAESSTLISSGPCSLDIDFFMYGPTIFRWITKPHPSPHKR